MIKSRNLHPLITFAYLAAMESAHTQPALAPQVDDAVKS